MSAAVPLSRGVDSQSSESAKRGREAGTEPAAEKCRRRRRCRGIPTAESSLLTVGGQGHPDCANASMVSSKMGRGLDPVGTLVLPDAGGWHFRRCFMTMMYLGLLASYITYLYFRIRYTLKTAKDPWDR